MLLAILGRRFPSRKLAQCPSAPAPQAARAAPRLPGSGWVHGAGSPLGRPTGGLDGVTPLFRDGDRSRGWAVLTEGLGTEMTVQLPLACVALVPAQTPSLPVLCGEPKMTSAPRAIWKSRALINPSVGRQEGPLRAVSTLQERPAATTILHTPGAAPR